MDQKGVAGPPLVSGTDMNCIFYEGKTGTGNVSNPFGTQNPFE